MEAGPYLDKLVCDKVMGIDYDNIHAPFRPKYSTSIADAWVVVEKLKEDPDYVSFRCEDTQGTLAAFADDFTKKWYVSFCLGRGSEAVGADALPHAICLAALRAMGHQI